MGLQGRDDLDDVATWYEERHPAGADRFFYSFDTALSVLSTFPNAGRERADIFAGLRSYVIHPFVALYIVDEHARMVTIVRVIHGRRDFDAADATYSGTLTGVFGTMEENVTYVRGEREDRD